MDVIQNTFPTPRRLLDLLSKGHPLPVFLYSQPSLVLSPLNRPIVQGQPLSKNFRVLYPPSETNMYVPQGTKGDRRGFKAPDSFGKGDAWALQSQTFGD